jgi:hypothetical protein
MVVATALDPEQCSSTSFDRVNGRAGAHARLVAAAEGNKMLTAVAKSLDTFSLSRCASAS